MWPSFVPIVHNWIDPLRDKVPALFLFLSPHPQSESTSEFACRQIRQRIEGDSIESSLIELTYSPILHWTALDNPIRVHLIRSHDGGDSEG